MPRGCPGPLSEQVEKAVLQRGRRGAVGARRWPGMLECKCGSLWGEREGGRGVLGKSGGSGIAESTARPCCPWWLFPEGAQCQGSPEILRDHREDPAWETPGTPAAGGPSGARTHQANPNLCLHPCPPTQSRVCSNSFV